MQFFACLVTREGLGSGPRPTATILKLIKGETKPYRLKDDRPKLDVPPELPPDVSLSEAEQRHWEYLIRTVYVPGVHGASDGHGSSRTE